VRKAPSSERKPGTNVPVNVVGEQDQVGALLEDRADPSRWSWSLRATALGLPGFTRKNALIAGRAGCLEFRVVELPTVLLARLDVHDLEVVVLEVRHLNTA